MTTLGGRNIPPALDDAVQQPNVKPFFAVRVELPDPVYAFTGVGRFSFPDADGATREWVGTGSIGALDTIGESTDGSATGVKATLLEVPSDFRDDVARQAVRGCLFEVYFGAFDEAFQVPVALALIWKGRLDQYKITDAGATLSVEITGESRAIDQRRPAIKRFTDEYQQRKYPGDLFFQFVPQMTEISILWAKAEQSTAAPVGGGGGGGTGGSDRFSREFGG